MGEVRTKVLLENEADSVLASAGYISKDKVRRLEVDALVDTGAVMTLLPQEVVEKLGLELDGNVIVTLADDRKIELRKARFLSLTIGDRQMDTNCLVGPPQSEPLIGQIVMESLDLIVDPLQRRLTPRPESPFIPSVKMK